MPFVPFVATPEDVVHRMLEFAKINSQDILYDLGSGDGRILITAIKQFNVKRAIGIESRADLVNKTIEEIKKRTLEDEIDVIKGDFHNVPLSEADVITLYLTTAANELLKPKLEKDLKDGTRIVSHDYEIAGWTPQRSENLGHHIIYLYIFKR